MIEKHIIRFMNRKRFLKLIFGLLIAWLMMPFLQVNHINAAAEDDSVVTGSAITVGENPIEDSGIATGGAIITDDIIAVTSGAIIVDDIVATNSAIEALFTDLNNEIVVNTEIKIKINELVKEISLGDINEKIENLLSKVGTYTERLSKSNAVIEEITRQIIELQAESDMAVDAENKEE